MITEKVRAIKKISRLLFRSIPTKIVKAKTVYDRKKEVDKEVITIELD